MMHWNACARRRVTENVANVTENVTGVTCHSRQALLIPW
jgi:hypothetical protein